MRLLICYGTRPEWIKLKKLIYGLKDSRVFVKVLFTGQHDNKICSDFEYDEKLTIMNGLNRLDSVVASVCSGQLANLKTKYDLTHVMVQGDTTTAMAVALSAVNNRIKVIHLEAGLRTYDIENPYPEEYNRRVISQVADVHLCPSEQNKENLLKENITKNIFVVGNTAIDNLVELKDKCAYNNRVLVTLHRRENHDNIKEWFSAIDELAKNHRDLEFLLPIHPNPNVRKYKDILANVKVVEPMSHAELLEYLVTTKVVITDSGGLQEECSFFNKKCLTCRIVTERPESVGTSTVLIKAPNDLKCEFEKSLTHFDIDFSCPYGDGSSIEKIIRCLVDFG